MGYFVCQHFESTAKNIDVFSRCYIVIDVTNFLFDVAALETITKRCKHQLKIISPSTTNRAGTPPSLVYRWVGEHTKCYNFPFPLFRFNLNFMCVFRHNFMLCFFLYIHISTFGLAFEVVIFIRVGIEDIMNCYRNLNVYFTQKIYKKLFQSFKLWK